MLVLNHGGRFKIQNLLHFLTNVESGILVGVITVPYRNKILFHANMHTNADNIRLFEQLADGGEHHVLPHLSEHRSTTVLLLLDLEDPTTSVGEALPHGGDVGACQ